MSFHIESKWIKVGSVNTHYLEAGEGPPLILIHGGGGSAEEEWSANLEQLATEHRVLAPDLVGYGKTDRPSAAYTWRFFYNFFEEFIAAIGLNRFSILAFSLGGSLALGLTLNHPEKVEKLVLVSSSGLTDKVSLMCKIILPIVTLKAKLKKDKTFLSLVKGGGAGERHEVFMERLPEISAPTLIMWGRWDGYLPVKLAYQAHKKLPNSRLHIFGKSWNAPQREESESFNQIVLEFLR